MGISYHHNGSSKGRLVYQDRVRSCIDDASAVRTSTGPDSGFFLSSVEASFYTLDQVPPVEDPSYRWGTAVLLHLAEVKEQL